MKTVGEYPTKIKNAKIFASLLESKGGKATRYGKIDKSRRLLSNVDTYTKISINPTSRVFSIYNIFISMRKKIGRLIFSLSFFRNFIKYLYRKEDINMQNKGKGWSIANAIVQGVIALGSLVGIFTAMKAEKYDKEQTYRELEDRYGLEPIDVLADEE